jgi:small-conductance mechanosensitive channel
MNSLQFVHFNFLLTLAQANSSESQNLSEASKIIDEITLNKVFQGLIIVLVAYVSLWVIDHFINWLSEKVPLKFRLNVKQSLPFTRAFIMGLAIVILLNLYLNLSPNNLIAITGTVVVALGFAFKDYVSSLMAGIIALFESPYQIGDRVKIGDYYGEIVSYGLRGILVQTPDDSIVTIPHNKLWTEAISNANKGAVEAQSVVNFYLSHNVDIDRVTQILYRTAYTSKYTQLKLPVLVVMEEKPWATYFKLKCYPIDARDEFIFKTDLTRRAKQAFTQINIDYPYTINAVNDSNDQ